jgi:hypothetical protein
VNRLLVATTDQLEPRSVTISSSTV